MARSVQEEYWYPGVRPSDMYGEYMSGDIYPWLGQGAQINPRNYSPLLFPPEPLMPLPIQSEFTPQTFGGGVVLDIEPNVSDRDRRIQAIEQRIADAPIRIEPFVSDRDRRIQALDKRIANSPIQINPFVSPQMADTQTNTSFMDNLGGLLFGGGGDGMEDYLTSKQQKAMQNQAMMQAAMSLLKSSGVRTTPISLGEALGEAYGAGTAGYQQAQQGAIQQLLTKQKLDEFKRKQAVQQFFMNRVPGMTTGAVPALAPAPVLAPAAAPSVQTAPADGSAPALADGSMQVMPKVTVTGKLRPDIFSTLTPDQMALIAMDTDAMLPKVFEESLKTESFTTLTPSEVTSLGLDPRGKYQQNLRTGQITSLQAPKDKFKIITGAEAEKVGLSGVAKWQFNEATNQATQVPEVDGAFGSSLAGIAYNQIVKGVNNGKTDTLEYLLAYRELSKPVPMEEVQTDGSTKIVYKQPQPLSTSIPRPTFKGTVPQVKNPATVVQPNAAQTAPPAVSTTPAAPPASAPVSETGIQSGVKSTPFAPTSDQVGAARKQILVAEKLVSAIDLLEKDVRQNGMQIGGMGQAGGTQEALFKDALLQLKELQNLGVLNGGDERILLEQLADPTSLKSLLKGFGGPEYVLSKITALRNKANREVEMINKQFPQSITTPKAAAEPPSPPPGVRDIIKKYPPRKP